MFTKRPSKQKTQFLACKKAYLFLCILDSDTQRNYEQKTGENPQTKIVVYNSLKFEKVPERQKNIHPQPIQRLKYKL